MIGAMKRLQRAIDYIEANLAEELTLARIARAACYSPYHFARSFRGRTGWSVMSYVQARRLTVAADRLVAERPPLLELALDSGFESQAAFTRAFKRKFDETPGAFRRNGDAWRRERTSQIILDLSEQAGDAQMQDPKFIDYPAFQAIGLKGSYSEAGRADIGRLWQRFNDEAARIDGGQATAAYGICMPADPDQGRFDYIAALAVAPGSAAPDGMVSVEIPAQHYAVFTHRVGDANLTRDLLPTLNLIWEQWLPASDYEYSGGPDFELYDDRFDPTGPDGPTGEFDIYVPVRRKG